MVFSSSTPPFDERARQQIEAAALVRHWRTLPDRPAHEFRRAGDDWWLTQSDYGAARFSADARRVQHYIRPEISTDEYQRFFEHEWLPLIYQTWGYTVLHASAVARGDGGTVLFTGMSGAGKSTLSFGLGQRPRWQQIADDSLALTVAADGITVVPLPNAIRLRPASAEYYAATPRAALDWPGETLRPRVIYLPEQDADHAAQPTIELLGPAQALDQLLDQLYVLDIDSRDVRRQVTANVLELIRYAPVFRLRYRRDFAAMETTLDAIEAHAAAL
jgi:hypothetical protein